MISNLSRIASQIVFGKGTATAFRFIFIDVYYSKNYDLTFSGQIIVVVHNLATVIR